MTPIHECIIEPCGDGHWARCVICGDDSFPLSGKAAGLPTRGAVEALAVVLELSPGQLEELSRLLWDDAETWWNAGAWKEDARASFAASALFNELARVVKARVKP